jgi:hypothetical protein
MAEPLDTVTVILPDSVNLARAPIPTNESEQVLFRHSFETLLRLDCKGEILPGLAVSWVADGTRRTWTFGLREGARLANGSPVTASLVASSWQRQRGMVEDLGIESAVVLDDRRLVVTLRDLRDSVPRLFAEPALSITHPPDSTSVSGTWNPGLGGGQAVVHFQVAPDTDPRDALDRGADILMTRSPALVEYAASRQDFAIFPLPWSRTYVLLQPATAEPLVTAAGELRSLAQDAVRADARAAEPPFWWNEVAACPARVSPGSTPTSSRVVYTRGDVVARGLAERAVAVAGSGTGLRTEALEPAEFIALLRSGAERAFVVALPRQTLAPCREAVALPEGARIQPLIDTRAHAIVRKGAPPLTVEWDGTVRVVEP